MGWKAYFLHMTIKGTWQTGINLHLCDQSLYSVKTFSAKNQLIQRPKQNNDAVVPLVLILTSDSPSLPSALVVRNENTSIPCLLVFVT